jgi:hypothetical protein
MRPLLPLLALLALPVAAANISGSWKLVGNIVDVHIDRVCTLKQVATKLTGTCKGPMNTITLTGEVEGNSITWTYVADYQGQKVTLVYKGILESDSIKGTITTEGAMGSFTATKQ